ncbi:MAG TPA: PKD domain-containing protein, partial [Thermoanaerobaculia bacterium]
YHGPASFTYEVCDNGITRGQSAPQCASAVVDVTVASVNDAPTASLSAPSSAVEGGAVSATVSSDDIDGDSLTISWTVTKDGAPFANGTGSNVSFTPDDNGAYVVTATAADASANGSATATVTVSNAAPSIASVTGPTSQLAAGGSSTIAVTYADAGAADTHTATFTWSDGATVPGTCTAGTCTATRTHAAAGIYTVSIVVADDDGATAASSFGNVVVYDVNAGFVTGGGWIATASGKANLNVNVKYQKGATPSGSTKFDVAGGTFQSTSHDWLVVTGSTATWQGSGAINGAGNYGFTVTVTDAATDSFAVRVYDKATNATVYETSGNLGGGSITIHR